MPAYLASKTILSSVLSVLKRLPSDSELVVLLDGFDLDSLKILSSLKDRRLRILISEKNQGVVKSRNELLRNARGDFIATIDADDMLLGDRLSKQLNFLSKNSNSIVFTNTFYHYDDNLILKIKPGIPFSMKNEVSKLALCLYDPFVNSTMMSSKETLMSLKGYRESTSEDYDLWLRAAVSGVNLVKFANYGGIYRIHKSQMTQSLQWQKNLRIDLNLTEAQNNLKKIVLGTDSNLIDNKSILESKLFKLSKKAFIEYKIYA